MRSTGAIGPLLARAAGLACVLAGLPTFPTPIPSGIPLMSLGLALLLAHSRLAPVWLCALRRRSTTADRLLSELETAAPGPFRRIVRRRQHRRRRRAPRVAAGVTE